MNKIAYMSSTDNSGWGRRWTDHPLCDRVCHLAQEETWNVVSEMEE